jgi:selenium metabolism protein YedF
VEIVDVRGQACPVPVLRTRKAIETLEEGEIRVLLDSPVAAENVTRTAEELGCRVERTDNGGIVLSVRRERAAGAPAQPAAAETPVLVGYINRDRMGEGDETLGAILMKAFLQTIREMTHKPRKLVFVNAGVFLTTEGSEHIDTLRELGNLGVDIISCGTCLDFYNRLDKLRVGRSSNMYEIVEVLAGADRVVQP